MTKVSEPVLWEAFIEASKRETFEGYKLTFVYALVMILVVYTYVDQLV